MGGGNESSVCKEAMTCRPLITMKQAKLAARLALAESDPEKSRAMHILALEYYDKADRVRTPETPPRPWLLFPDTLVAPGWSSMAKN